MALAYLAWEQIFLEERVLIIGRRLERRILRDGHNPFELPNDEFMGAFRLSQQLVINIIDALRTSLQHKRTSGLSPELQVLVCLHFYAQESYQKGLGGNSILNISQPSVSRCIHYVTEAINQRLLRKWIKFPMTGAERQRARENFAHAPQSFEGTIGAIDCTYIHILAPRQHEEAYVNHHGKHSLNVQDIVNSKLQVLNINARYPGARNDSYIWSMSPVRRGMEYHYNNGERQTWLIELAFSIDKNPFTYGMCDWKHIYQRISKQENSKGHNQCCEAYFMHIQKRDVGSLLMENQMHQQREEVKKK
ncbi:putative nuclease HARBI1 [Rhopalosiphum padi]|uniref:putative nuclease HARBI1 n=1 Tax=Rhopalosiphum padi TaxID=40932 RepID=UPI00298E1C14|nr:putative nuclease HARBI1 [Rhopalosiphum padi]